MSTQDVTPVVLRHIFADPDDRPGFDLTVNWPLLERIHDVALRRLPAPADAGIAHAWAGLYEMSPDGMPFIGPNPRLHGAFLIAGFSGHGFQHSPDREVL